LSIRCFEAARRDHRVRRLAADKAALARRASAAAAALAEARWAAAAASANPKELPSRRQELADAKKVRRLACFVTFLIVVFVLVNPPCLDRIYSSLSFNFQNFPRYLSSSSSFFMLNFYT